jgi:anti-anti-sigma factor
MQTSLTLGTARHNDGQFLIAAGEIDLSNIDAFKQALATIVTQAAGSGEMLTVDLTEVEYLDSAAINALFARVDHINKLIAHPLLMDILTISGLTELVTTEVAPPTAEP